MNVEYYKLPSYSGVKHGSVEQGRVNQEVKKVRESAIEYIINCVVMAGLPETDEQLKQAVECMQKRKKSGPDRERKPLYKLAYEFITGADKRSGRELYDRLKIGYIEMKKIMKRIKEKIGVSVEYNDKDDVYQVVKQRPAIVNAEGRTYQELIGEEGAIVIKENNQSEALVLDRILPGSTTILSDDFEEEDFLIIDGNDLTI